MSAGGVSSVIGGKKHGFAIAATDPLVALDDPDTAAVVIATRHDTHAKYVIEALRRRKHVFVEKPLAISAEQLDAIVAARDEAIAEGFEPIIVTGFNRRFAPHTRKMRELLATVSEPKVFVMTVNAGEIPSDHWTQDPAIGGGRIIGEACHFVDLLRFLADSPIRRTRAVMIGEAPGSESWRTRRRSCWSLTMGRSAVFTTWRTGTAPCRRRDSRYSAAGEYSS